MRTKKHKKKGYNSVPEFVANYPKITVKLTNHVFDRLKQRMGWSRKYAQKILGGKRKINMSLSNSIVANSFCFVIISKLKS